MRLKAIASPPAVGEGARGGALLSPRNGAGRSVCVAVPSSTRLDCFADSVAALEGAYLLEDWVAARSFSCPGPGRAVPGYVQGPTESATHG